jgi:hypothetical protein
MSAGKSPQVIDAFVYNGPEMLLLERNVRTSVAIDRDKHCKQL